MYRKSNFRILIILFILLLIVVAVIKITDFYKGDKTFRSDLIKLDSSAVTVINFFPKSTQFKQITLYRNGKNWSVRYGNKTWSADPNIVESILSEFVNMKTDRIASTEQSKWKEFGVTQDEGVRVKVLENNKLDADFIIGKAVYSKSSNPYIQGSMSTYIRLINDDKVYAVNGYLNILFNRNFNDFRNGAILKVRKDKITKLKFTYPGDSSFVLQRKDNKWFVNDIPADSVSVNNYLNSISHLSSNDFADDYNYAQFRGVFYTLAVEGSNLNNVFIKAYPASEPVKHVLTSSINNEGKFRGDRNNLFNKVFVGKNQFINKLVKK